MSLRSETRNSGSIRRRRAITCCASSKADDRNISEYTAEYEEDLPVRSAGQGWVGRDVTCQGQYAPFDPSFSEAPVPQQRSVTEHDRIDLHRPEDGEQCVPQRGPLIGSTWESRQGPTQILEHRVVREANGFARASEPL
jgi:hypothetical protein